MHDLRVEIAKTGIPPEEADAFVDAVRRDWRSAPLSAPDRALAAYAAKLTHKTTTTSEADLDELRRHGFDDRAILDAVHVIALFNYMTRVADGLGVKLDGFLADEFGAGR